MKTAAEWATWAAHNSETCLDEHEAGEDVCDLCIQCADIIRDAQLDAFRAGFVAGTEAQREADAKAACCRIPKIHQRRCPDILANPLTPPPERLP
jgi:hypothetical protein